MIHMNKIIRNLTLPCVACSMIHAHADINYNDTDVLENSMKIKVLAEERKLEKINELVEQSQSNANKYMELHHQEINRIAEEAKAITKKANTVFAKQNQLPNIENLTTADNANDDTKTVAKDLASMDKRFLFFISAGLGEANLKQIFLEADKEDVFIFRGIPNNLRTFNEGQQWLKRLFPDNGRPPNVIINPDWFRQYDVQSVPQVVYEHRSKSISVKAIGAIDKSRLVELSQNQQSGVLAGRFSEVEAIKERDLIEEMQARMAAIDWKEKQEQAFHNFWKTRPTTEITPAQENRARHVDMTVVVTDKVQLKDGRVLATKGQTINPLELVDFPLVIIVFDGQSADERAFSKKLAEKIRKRPLKLISTGFDPDNGWEELDQTETMFSRPVFLLDPEIKNRMHLEHTVSVILQSPKDKGKLAVLEFGKDSVANMDTSALDDLGIKL
jgi:conjugal transfer pilus assembly protein TraW